MRVRKIARKVTARVAPTEKTIGDAFAEFITAKEIQGLSPATIRSYTQSYGYFIEFNDFDEDTVKVNEVQASDFHEWIATMQEDTGMMKINLPIHQTTSH